MMTRTTIPPTLAVLVALACADDSTAPSADENWPAAVANEASARATDCALTPQGDSARTVELGGHRASPSRIALTERAGGRDSDYEDGKSEPKELQIMARPTATIERIEIDKNLSGTKVLRVSDIGVDLDGLSTDDKVAAEGLEEGLMAGGQIIIRIDVGQ